ncbi:Argininosuccinate lyase [Variovorax sp. SRS16]|uniref:Bug family tripartite tricarboxylate transporter substrate binding protein n=1 Tax=Variovorax sp. SRS16 TaxID=282217 RepID=UPI001316810A|nr:tripartite tricarboxylate transporter substrate binding protein [Variovorax sp. SRS16]VTU20590.1 Argininosuccinate lyase [Variovorax sp. SRS16]
MKSLTRRRALQIFAAGGAAATVARMPVLAQSGDAFPSKLIRIIVPYPAGGTTDQLARAIAQPMRDILGQAVIIENKPGAGGTLGADYVAHQHGDGYTLLFGNSGPSATASMMRTLPYDIHKDFRPLSGVVKVPLILAVAADSPHKTVKDFVAWARPQGTALNYGSTGVGGSSHLASEYFNELAGTKLQHIPYSGGAPLVTAFAGGQVQAAFVTGMDGAAMVQAGRIRYLAVASPKRTEVLPGLPAIAEDVPGFNAVVWFGLLAPKNVPDAIADKLNAAIVAAVRKPEVRKFFIDRNVEPWGSTPQELASTIDAEVAQWGPIIKKANITM